ncbi:cation-translocating P-type ATPase [Alkalihalobacterium elongatum]|uniref:cation-translocating P-type ATPase n=1 Tax=Alkalihalobacterium elongatum TaxID=2675466 RepID=UPI001C1FB3B5|nr:HAD-IC family P-type ATPase [Alkalihalobacterium elongatum]
MKNWHTYSLEKMFSAYSSTVHGLSDQEVNRRLNEYGKNVLPSEPPPSIYKIFLLQFKSPLIYILLLAGVISLFLKEFIDAGFILIVLLLNALIGTYQEWNAAKSAKALQKIVPHTAQVIRNGQKSMVDVENLVPGDIVLLDPGLKVPADMRLIEANSLSIDESLLTGESIPVTKQTAALPKENIPLGDRINMAFASTVVTRGSGLGLITETAEKTEIGKIAASVFAPSDVKTPLIQRMEVFTKNVAIAILGATILLALLALFKGYEHKEIFFMAVALAVAAIPEGLPVGITVTLANGMNRMTKLSVIVRNLVAVEGLGSCTVIASDKTGTLTHNELTVKRLALPNGEQLRVSGEGYQPNGKIEANSDQKQLAYNLIQTSVLCNEGTIYEKEDGWHHQGDSVDVALLILGEKESISMTSLLSKYAQVGIIPFDADYRYAATANQVSESEMDINVKGALEALLPMCSHMQTKDGLAPISSELIEKQALDLARNGYRVLAFTKKTTALVEGQLKHEHLNEMIFLGLVAMIDPIRQEAKVAVRESIEAGVNVCMVTGDHPVTALAISKELGIATSEKEVVTGAELTELEKSMSEEEFNHFVAEKTVFARVEPIQKQTIVKALMSNGHFVAVTGDGVNDAPALKEANIGVAMGSGTDVAKETADIVITDDNFSSIVAGIKQGRVSYNNIRKVIYLLVSTGVAEVVLFILSILFGYPLPLLAAQILWLNLVTNGVQHVALAFEPEEGDEMKQKPRSPKESVFNPIMIRQIITSGVFIGAVAFLAWVVMIDVFNLSEFTARNLVLLLVVFFENFHVLNCRSEKKSIFSMRFFSNRLLIWAIIAAQAIHIGATYIPFMQVVLNVEPVTLIEWFIMMAVAASVLIMMEIFKFIERKQSGN